MVSGYDLAREKQLLLLVVDDSNIWRVRNDWTNIFSCFLIRTILIIVVITVFLLLSYLDFIGCMTVWLISSGKRSFYSRRSNKVFTSKFAADFPDQNMLDVGCRAQWRKQCNNSNKDNNNSPHKNYMNNDNTLS